MMLQPNEELDLTDITRHLNEQISFIRISYGHVVLTQIIFHDIKEIVEWKFDSKVFRNFSCVIQVLFTMKHKLGFIMYY